MFKGELHALRCEASIVCSFREMGPSLLLKKGEGELADLTGREEGSSVERRGWGHSGK